MSLKIIKCAEPTLNCFINNLKKDGFGQIVSVEQSCNYRTNSQAKYIVLGKIIRITSSITEASNSWTIIIKEVLADGQYGQKAKVVVCGELAPQLQQFGPRTGDRLAFYRPLTFPNTDLEMEPRDPHYVLTVGTSRGSLMWCARKGLLVVDKDPPRSAKELVNGMTRSPQKLPVSNVEDPSSSYDSPKKPQAAENSTSPNDRANRDVSPKKPKGAGGVMASNQQTNRVNSQQKAKSLVGLSPRYAYKSLAEILHNAQTGDMARVNLFAVVHLITKTLMQTNNGKFTIICKIIDESMEYNLGAFNLHFFIADDNILKQIEEGDVIRVHRVKMEKFNDKVDGRIFHNQDILLFKKNSKVVPITSTTNVMFTDKEKAYVEHLREWYKGEQSAVAARLVAVADVSEAGSYHLCVKVLQVEDVQSPEVVLQATDGTCPAENSFSQKSGLPSWVIRITCTTNLSFYANLKPGTVLFLPNVEASWTPKGQLLFNISKKSYAVFKKHTDQEVKLIEGRLKALESRQLRSSEKNTVNNNGAIDKSPEKSPTNSKTAVQTANDENICMSPKKHCATKAKDPVEEESDINTHCTRNKTREREQQSQQTLLNNTTPKPGTSKNPKRTKRSISVSEKEDGSDTSKNKKQRKLFTASCQDLSEASDEVSDKIETTSHEGAPEQSEDPVTRTNTSFNEFVNIVKSKYCSPRVLHDRTKASNEDSTGHNTRSYRKKLDEDPRSPVVKLLRMNDQESSRGDSQSVKRAAEDLDEDTSTIYNMTLQRGKRTRPGSLSTNRGGDGTSKRLSSARSVDNLQEPLQKVCNWLEHPQNRLNMRTRDADLEELSDEEVKIILLNQVPEDPDMSRYTAVNYLRTNVFLTGISPDSNETLDMVSGYCYSGCHQLFIYRSILWKPDMVPHCPQCFRLKQPRELELMLLFELRVMDNDGQHKSVVFIREHAEQFLNCTVAEFIQDTKLRETRVRLLMDNTVQHTLHQEFTPRLDLTIARVNSVYCGLNCSLRLPPT